MSWTCKYDLNGYCQKLNKNCLPGQIGCILYKYYKDNKRK